MLHVEEPVVVRGQLALLREPGLGAGIRRGDGQVDDLWNGQRPVAHGGEPCLVPVGVGDDVDGHGQAQSPGDLQRLHVGIGRHALAMPLERLGIERLHAEEHVEETEPSPVGEDLLVAEQHVATRLEVVLLADAPPLYLAADREAVLGVDERHVVDQEHVGLLDAGQVLGGRLGGGLAVAAAVERPGAAERAIPGAAARELGRGARVEHAEEVPVAAPAEIARRRKAVEVVQ